MAVGVEVKNSVDLKDELGQNALGKVLILIEGSKWSCIGLTMRTMMGALGRSMRG